MADNMDPAKMKVVELRAELSSRGLDTKGNKAALVDRLREALETETGNAIQETSIMETSTEESFHEDREAEDPSLSHRDKRQKLEEPDVAAESYGENGNVRIKEEPDRSDYYPKQEAQEREPMTFKEEKPQLQSPIKSEDKYENKVKDETQISNNVKTEVKTEPQTYEERRGEKRSHSPPPSNVYTFYKEDEPDYDEKAVMLSWYDSDLNLVIDKQNFHVATPMYEQGFGYVWAGARASYGFKQGKVFYEVKILENCDVSHLEDEPSPHVVRIGWSVIGTSMQLGEEPMSYGFGGTGKISTDCKFKDYGKPFTEGDVVGAFLDMDTKSITMSYTINGKPMGVAYTIPHSHLDERALYPHVLTKNSKFECNFGDKEPWFQPLAGYMFVGEVPFERRIAGPARPARREDCEMLMMCGLPACGKTTWANDWYAKNLDSMYNILGTNSLIDKMKVMGLPRKRNYAGRWDVLIEKCSKCLNKLFEIGGRRRRNYILDQTNVYPNAQRRKMKGFEGFVRRAIVIVPTDEEFKRRCALQEKVEGKDVPDSAVLEMKANFELPVLGDPFDEVRFVELQESEAQALIDQYRKEAADAGYTPQKLQRGRGFRNRGGGNNFRGGFQSKGSSGGGGGGDRNRDGGGGGGGGDRDRNRGGGDRNRGSGGGGNWQQKKEESSASDSWREKIQQFGSGRSNGPSGGGSRDGGGGNWRGGRGGRGNDHRGRSDSYSSRGSDSYGGRDSYSSRGSDSGYDRNRSSGGRDGGYSGNRNQSGGGKGNWGSGYNQGGGSGGGGGSSWSSSSGDGGSGSWGQQSYGQQGSWGGGQQNYAQQGWKGGYGQQGSGYSGQGGYGQQQSYGQQGYGGSGGGGTGGGAGGGGSNNYSNWNQQYYGGSGGNQGYAGSTQGGWGQSGDGGGGGGGGGGYGSGYGQQQSTWQGYGQGYGYGQGQQPK